MDMQKIRLGRTGVEVSVVGLGCGGSSRLGMAAGVSAEEASRVVSFAIDQGVTFIDTAALYGTEAAVGLGVAGRRDKVFISTKAAPRGRPGDKTQPPLTPEALIQSLDDSLRNLQVDHVDLFHLHGVTDDVLDHCVDVIVPALERAREAGKFRFLGVTEHFGSDTAHVMLPRAIAGGAFDVVMTGFSMLNPSARRSVFPVSRAHDVGTLIMFAVRRALSRPEALRALVAELIASGSVDAADLDPEDPLGFVTDHPEVADLVQAAYRFCRHEPGADVILTGTGSVDHLRENIASILAPPLPAEVLARLDQVFGRVDSISGN